MPLNEQLALRGPHSGAGEKGGEAKHGVGEEPASPLPTYSWLMYAVIVSTATPPSLPSSSSKKGLAYRLRPIVCTGMTPPPLSVDACR